MQPSQRTGTATASATSSSVFAASAPDVVREATSVRYPSPGPARLRDLSDHRSQLLAYSFQSRMLMTILPCVVARFPVRQRIDSFGTATRRFAQKLDPRALYADSA